MPFKMPYPVRKAVFALWCFARNGISIRTIPVFHSRRRAEKKQLRTSGTLFRRSALSVKITICIACLSRTLVTRANKFQRFHMSVVVFCCYFPVCVFFSMEVNFLCNAEMADVRCAVFDRNLCRNNGFPNICPC